MTKPTVTVPRSDMLELLEEVQSARDGILVEHVRGGFQRVVWALERWLAENEK
ncbi:MAG: hypothetical protein H0X04_04895 [Chthoniobacterales bacterium]|nr:hypothetical protein [Chthoniobacterales bacterium]